jgi:hypothetical protein
MSMDKTIKEEIIYYRKIKMKMVDILSEIKRKDIAEVFELLDISRKLIPLIENLRESNYFKPLKNLNKALVISALKHTLSQEGDRLLMIRAPRYSNKVKDNAIIEFKYNITRDLSLVEHALNHLKLEDN